MAMFEFEIVKLIEVLGSIRTENLALILVSFSFCFWVWCIGRKVR